MRLKIYQINSDRDPKRSKFTSLKHYRSLNGTNDVDSSMYDKVLDADIEKKNLEEIFCQFNTVGHPLFRGHSLSVSDVVVTEKGAFYCDDVGFKSIKFDESKTQIPENTYRIVYVEPNKPAYATEIEKSLTGLQKAVNGFIEAIYDTDDETVYVGNEEAKLIGMPGNRHMSNGKSIIAGPFFVIGDGGEDFRSLTDEEINKYVEKFAEPENISDQEVLDDTGYEIWGFNPKL